MDRWTESAGVATLYSFASLNLPRDESSACPPVRPEVSRVTAAEPGSRLSSVWGTDSARGRVARREQAVGLSSRRRESRHGAWLAPSVFGTMAKEGL